MNPWAFMFSETGTNVRLVNWNQPPTVTPNPPVVTGNVHRAQFDRTVGSIPPTFDTEKQAYSFSGISQEIMSYELYCYW